jgi:hypothetical protein
MTRAPLASRNAVGDELWQPQLLLRGNATRLTPYLDRAARGLERRPLAFNRPVQHDVARRAFARVAHLGSPAVMRHPTLQSDSALAGGAGLDLFVGPRGAGLPMHHHGAVWNALHWGRKLWALTPPASAAFGPPAQHPLDSGWFAEWSARGDSNPAHQALADADGGMWLHAAREASTRNASVGEGGSLFFCEQRAGDVLYVPPHWAHATLSLDESLSVGGFLHDDHALSLHMQLVHAPRGIGSLQNAATLHADWFAAVARAFPR